MVTTAEDTASVAEMLADAMRSRDLSQSELARQLDVSQQTVSRWVTGQAVPKGAVHVRAVARFLRVPVEEVRNLAAQPASDRLARVEKRMDELERLMTRLATALVERGLVENPDGSTAKKSASRRRTR